MKHGSVTLLLVALLFGVPVSAADSPITLGGSIGYSWQLSDPATTAPDDASVQFRQSYLLNGVGPVIDPIIGSYNATVAFNVNSYSPEDTGGVDSVAGQSLTVDARLFPMSPFTLALGGGVRSGETDPTGAGAKLDEYSAYTRMGLALPRLPSVTLTLSRTAENSQFVADGTGESRESIGVDLVELTSQYAFGARNHASVSAVSIQRRNEDGDQNGEVLSASGKLTFYPVKQLQVLLSGDGSQTSQENSWTGETDTTATRSVDLRSVYTMSPRYTVRAALSNRDQEIVQHGARSEGGGDQARVELIGRVAQGLTVLATANKYDNNSYRDADKDGTLEQVRIGQQAARLEVRNTRLARTAIVTSAEYKQASVSGEKYVPAVKAQARVEYQALDTLGTLVDLQVTSPVTRPSLPDDVKSNQAVQGQVKLITQVISNLTAGYRVSSVTHVDNFYDRREGGASVSYAITPWAYLTLSGEYQRSRVDKPNDVNALWQETAGLSANIVYRPLPELTLTLGAADQDVTRYGKVLGVLKRQQGKETTVTLKGEYQYYAIKFMLEAVAGQRTGQGLTVEEESEGRYAFKLGAQRNF